MSVFVKLGGGFHFIDPEIECEVSEANDQEAQGHTVVNGKSEAKQALLFPQPQAVFLNNCPVI